MINYTKRPAKYPTAAEVTAALQIPRLPDGRIDYSHPRRVPIGTLVLRANESVTLNASGGHRVTHADGTSRTVFARKQ